MTSVPSSELRRIAGPSHVDPLPSTAASSNDAASARHDGRVRASPEPGLGTFVMNCSSRIVRPDRVDHATTGPRQARHHRSDGNGGNFGDLTIFEPLNIAQ